MTLHLNDKPEGGWTLGLGRLAHPPNRVSAESDKENRQSHCISGCGTVLRGREVGVGGVRGYEKAGALTALTAVSC